MLAPVLSYTAEEAWEHIPKEKEEKVSVHLSMWPKVDEKIKDYPQKEVWQDILRVRDEFFKVLEAERRAGKLNQSLEASVNIYLPQREKFFEDIETFLKEVLIVSEVKVFDAPSLKVEVFKHKGTKCPRCWQYAYKEEQDLCERCKEVVQHH
jgi:isoleucyl-tRNA synthetase